MFKAMHYETGRLSLLDQRKLPLEESWIHARDLETVAKAIEDMVVRGAPAIGCAAAWGVVVAAESAASKQAKLLWKDYQSEFSEVIDRLAKTRPTAVNLFYALQAMQQASSKLTGETSIKEVAATMYERALFLEQDDLRTCRAIGAHGASMFDRPITVLTHCNTGSLATAGYGTALGIVRALSERSLIKSVFVDETRPYLQGARLTAYELQQEKIPYKLITDNMAAYAMQRGWVDLVVVGADRISANGDTANKIGTYGLAVLCKHHGIPFVVAAPLATVDTKISDGSSIPVEERPSQEILEIQGVAIAPRQAQVWNPSFDVTPHHLITAIVTEKGVQRPPYSF